MADLVIRVTDTTTAGTSNEVTVTPQDNGHNIPDAAPRSITEAEASRALDLVESYLNSRSEHSINLDRLGIRVGSKDTNLTRLASAFTGLQARINTIRSNTHVIQPPAPTTPVPTPTPPAPLPVQVAPATTVVPGTAPTLAPTGTANTTQTVQVSPPSVGRHGINVSADFASTTAPGFNSGTVNTTSVAVSWNPYLAWGSQGNFGFNLGIGARGIFGSPSVHATAGGPLVRAGVNGELRLGSSPLALFGGGDAELFGIWGEHQIPGESYRNNLEGNFGVGVRGMLGLRAYVTRGTSLDFAWAPQFQHIGDAVRGIDGQSHDLNYSSVLGFLLGLTSHPTRAIQVNGQDLCMPYEMTPNGARTLIGDLRNIIASLRDENTRARAAVATRFPGLQLDTELPVIADAEHLENGDISGNQCPDLTAMIRNLIERGTRLAEQNGELARLQPLPQGADPRYIHALIQIHHISYLTGRPYTTASTGDRMDNVPSGIRSTSAITIEALRTNIAAAVAAAPNHVLSPEQRRNVFAGLFAPEVVGSDYRYISCDTLDRVSEALNSPAFRGYKVLIVGHADHGGAAEYNLRLTSRRAEAAGLYLSSSGVDGNRVTTFGVGEAEGVYEHDLPTNRPRATAEDRRNMMTQAEIRELHNLGIRDRDLNALVAGRAVTNRAMDIYLYREEDIADTNNHTGDNDYVRATLARARAANNTSDAASAGRATNLDGDAGVPQGDAGADASVQSDASAPNG